MNCDHEWKLTVGHSNCKSCHYSAIEGVAVCELCNESLGPTEIERILNGFTKMEDKYGKVLIENSKLEMAIGDASHSILHALSALEEARKWQSED